MPIPVKCSGCGQTYRVPDAAAGKATKCKKCGGVIKIPAGAPAAAFSAAAPMPAAAGFEPPTGAAAPSPRRKRKSKLLLGLAASVFLVFFLVSSYVVARWFLGGAGLGTTTTYFPDNTQVVGVVNVEDFLNGSLYAELKKAVPETAKGMEESPIDVTKIRRIIGASDPTSNTDVAIFECNSTPSADDIKARIKKSKPWVKEFTEEKVGAHTVYSYTAMMTFQQVGQMIHAGGQPPEEVKPPEPPKPDPKFIEAFCLPEDGIVVMTNLEAIKKILNRGMAPELSAELTSAIGALDLSKTVALALVVEKMPAKEFRFVLGPAVDQVKNVKSVTAEIDATSNVVARVVVECKEEKKAKELSDLAVGGITLVKTMAKQGMPPEAMKVLEAVKIEPSGVTIVGTVELEQELAIKALKAADIFTPRKQTFQQVGSPISGGGN